MLSFIHFIIEPKNGETVRGRKESSEDDDGKVKIALPEDFAVILPLRGRVACPRPDPTVPALSLITAKPVRAELFARETALRATKLRKFWDGHRR